jgi:uncharacterized protein (DUF2384 family)
MEIPQEVRELVGGAMTLANLEKWWNSPHPMLNGLSPANVWLEGPAGQERVRSHIEAAKSGDMA